MTEIALTTGEVILLDDADLVIVGQYRWRPLPGQRTTYAQTKKGMLLHRLLLPDSEEVDHKNGNGLDNRRCNLRAVTRKQNAQNLPKRADSKYRFKGVRRNGRRWCAYIRVDGIRLHLGQFDSDIEAAAAYNCAAKHHFGEFARLNEVTNAVTD